MTLVYVIIIGKILRDKVIIFIYVSRHENINIISYTICLATDVLEYFWENKSILHHLSQCVRYCSECQEQERKIFVLLWAST